MMIFNLYYTSVIFTIDHTFVRFKVETHSSFKSENLVQSRRIRSSIELFVRFMFHGIRRTHRLTWFHLTTVDENSNLLVGYTFRSKNPDDLRTELEI